MRQSKCLIVELLELLEKRVGWVFPDAGLALTSRNQEHALYEDPDAIAAYIHKAITAAHAGKEVVLPIFNYYNRVGSTRYANGLTTRPVFATTKSHVNYVVADTKSWEQITAKTLEELDSVLSYVKNAYVGFTVAYVADGKRERDGWKQWAFIEIANDIRNQLVAKIGGME